MKISLLMLGTGLAFVAGGGGLRADDFTCCYRGDREPETADATDADRSPSWARTGPSGRTAGSEFAATEGLADPGFLRAVSNGPITRLFWTLQGPWWKPKDAFTVESRLRILQAEGEHAWEMIVDTGDRRFIFRVGPTRLGFTNHDGMTDAGRVTSLKSGEFNVYRVVGRRLREDGMWRCSLYVNGDKVPVMATGVAGSSPSLIFGNTSIKWGGTTDLDYLRWNDRDSLE